MQRRSTKVIKQNDTCHVKVGQRGPRGPVHGPGLDSLDPQVVGEHEGEDGDALVVVRPGHRSGDVPGHDGDETGREKSRPARPELLGEQVSRDGRETAEQRRQEDADVPDVGRDVEVGEDVVDGPGRDHQTGVDRSTDDPTERVPGAVVEPVEEVVEAILDHVGC